MSSCERPSRSRYAAGCRCDACRAANRDYERARQRRKLYGEPSGMVDAEPVRAMVRRLVDGGMSLREVCRASGVARSTMNQLMNAHPRTGEPVRRCRREIKDRIAGIRRRAVRPRELVDASWMRGWLSEWKSQGVPATKVAELTGVSRQVLSGVNRGRERVTAETLRRFCAGKPRVDALLEPSPDVEVEL